MEEKRRARHTYGRYKTEEKYGMCKCKRKKEKKRQRKYMGKNGKGLGRKYTGFLWKRKCGTDIIGNRSNT